MQWKHTSSSAPMKAMVIYSARKLWLLVLCRQKALCLSWKGPNYQWKIVYQLAESVRKRYQELPKKCDKSEFCFIRTLLYYTSPWFQWLLCWTVAFKCFLTFPYSSDLTNICSPSWKTYGWETVLSCWWRYIYRWLLFLTNRMNSLLERNNAIF